MVFMTKINEFNMMGKKGFVTHQGKTQALSTNHIPQEVCPLPVDGIITSLYERDHGKTSVLSAKAMATM